MEPTLPQTPGRTQLRRVRPGTRGPEATDEKSRPGRKGLKIKGIYGREMFETWYKMGAMIQGGLDISPVITHRFKYTDYEKGFEAMISGRSGKVILDWEA